MLKIILSNSFLRSVINLYCFKEVTNSQYVMMKNPAPKEEKIIKKITNLFRLKKEQNVTGIKDIRNLFRLKKEIKGIKDILLRNIKNLILSMKKKKNIIINQ